MARLNIASSRVRFSSRSFARIAQTWPGRNGGFGPGILPLFPAGRPRRGVVLDGGSLSFMVSLPALETFQLAIKKEEPVDLRPLPSKIRPGMVTHRSRPRRNVTLSGNRADQFAVMQQGHQRDYVIACHPRP